MFKVSEDRYRLPCKCGTTEHNLDLIIFDDEDPFVDFFVSIGASQKDTSLWKRIKLAWKVLTKGETCFAEVVLSPSQATALGTYLQERGIKAEIKNARKADGVLDGPAEFLEHK